MLLMSHKVSLNIRYHKIPIKLGNGNIYYHYSLYVYKLLLYLRHYNVVIALIVSGFVIFINVLSKFVSVT